MAVTLPLRTTNTEITVLFGDLFDRVSDHLAISVNDGFDGALGTLVDPKSVHGQFIQKCYGGSQRDFEAACDALLINAKRTKSRKDSRPTQKIGSTVHVAFGGRKAFLFALAVTDPLTHKARADVPKMLTALSGLWSYVRNHSNGHAVALPLVGAGQSGVGIEPRHLLRLILLSILVATRDGEVCKRINIVLHPDLFDKIDLLSLKNDWS